jgi:hypothetical protein
MNGNLRWLTIGSIGKIDFDNARPRKYGERNSTDRFSNT